MVSYSPLHVLAEVDPVPAASSAPGVYISTHAFAHIGEEPQPNESVHRLARHAAEAEAEPGPESEQEPEPQQEEPKPEVHSAEGPLQPTVNPELVAEIKQTVREFTSPQILQARQHVLRNPEPEYGYWGPYVNSVGTDGARRYRAMSEQALKTAQATAPEDRTAFDTYVLDKSSPPDDYAAKVRHGIYHLKTVERSLAALRNGNMPEDFTDVPSMERATALMIESGLGDFNQSYGGHRNAKLEGAAAILLEATQRIPGFNPANASLDRLYDTAILLCGVLDAESPQWTLMRRGRGLPDDMVEMTYGCLDAAESTIATLFAQQRQGILLNAPTTEPAAV